MSSGKLHRSLRCLEFPIHPTVPVGSEQRSCTLFFHLIGFRNIIKPFAPRAIKVGWMMGAPIIDIIISCFTISLPFPCYPLTCCSSFKGGKRANKQITSLTHTCSFLHKWATAKLRDTLSLGIRSQEPNGRRRETEGVKSAPGYCVFQCQPPELQSSGSTGAA